MIDPMDSGLLRALAAVFERHDPVPAAVCGAAERAGVLVGPARAWTALALVGPAGVRGDDGPLLGFADRHGRVDVEIDTDGDTVALTGLFRGSGAVWVRWPAGERRAAVDDVGRFTVDGLPRGPLSVVVRRPDGDAAGPWFVG